MTKSNRIGATPGTMRVLFVCTGNQCRSPMAKVLMERRLEELGLGDRISVDSAGTLYDPGEPASEGARTAVLKACGKDLLADHRSKHLSEVTPNEYDLILTMGKKHEAGLPTGKTFTIKEYAGIGGDVADPFRRPQEEYDICCQELKALIDRVIRKLMPGLNDK